MSENVYIIVHLGSFVNTLSHVMLLHEWYFDRFFRVRSSICCFVALQS